MNVTIEDGGPCRKVMHVAVPAEVVGKEYDAVVLEYARSAKVPGFRQGKSPIDLVEKRYRKGILQDAQERLIPRCYTEAVAKEKIDPVAILQVKDAQLDPQTGMRFTVVVDVAPEFDLPKYKKIPLKRQKVEVTDKQVDDTVQRLRESAARFEDVTGRSVRRDDMVMLDYAGSLDGSPLSAVVPDYAGLGEGKDFWVHLGGEREFIPGFVEGLDGAMQGETKRFPANFPPDFHVAAVAGKTAQYTATVKAVRERILPELNDEFLKQFGMASEAELRERVKSDLLSVAERKEKDQMKNEIARFLIENTKLDLPQSIVQEEMRLTIREMIRNFTQQGVTAAQVEEKKTEILDSATRSSTERVKLSYILSRIAHEENVEVGDEEVEKRLAEIAARYGVPVERIKADLEKRNGITAFRSDLRSEKTMDLLLEISKK